MKMTIISLVALLSTTMLARLAEANAGPSMRTLPLKGTYVQNETQEINFPLMATEGGGGGLATVLGRYTEHTVFSEVNLITTAGTGMATYTAANGDTIRTKIDASAGPGGPGVWVVTEHHTITGGTGRFDGASGSFTVVRQFDDSSRPTSSHGHLSGTIVLHGRENGN